MALRGEPLPRAPQGPGRYVTRAEFEQLRAVAPDGDVARAVRAFWYPPWPGAELVVDGRRVPIVDPRLLEELAGVLRSTGQVPVTRAGGYGVASWSWPVITTTVASPASCWTVGVDRLALADLQSAADRHRLAPVATGELHHRLGALLVGVGAVVDVADAGSRRCCSSSLTCAARPGTVVPLSTATVTLAGFDRRLAVSDRRRRRPHFRRRPLSGLVPPRRRRRCRAG